MQRGESGNILLEVLVGLTLLTLIGIGLARSSMLSTSTRNQAIWGSTAQQIAADTIEQYSLQDPGLIISDETFSDVVTRKRTTFNRTISITINPDTSRTIVVAVASTTPRVRGKASLSVTLAPWGSASATSLQPPVTGIDETDVSGNDGSGR